MLSRLGQDVFVDVWIILDRVGDLHPVIDGFDYDVVDGGSIYCWEVA